MYNLSIVIPSIRTENWPLLLDSIAKSCTRYTYEVIFVGPHVHDCINGTIANRNVKFIRDLGHPNRCQHLGSLIAEGEVIHFGSDDCVYMESMVDQALDLLKGKDVVTTNYKEGGNPQIDLSILKCYGNNDFSDIKPHWLIFNVAFFQKLFFDWLGGFNTSYATTCWGHTSLAATAHIHFKKMKIAVLDKPVLECSHMPGLSGDHAPIHLSFYEDEKLFKKDRFVEKSINDWKKDSGPVWERRYGS